MHTFQADNPSHLHRNVQQTSYTWPTGSIMAYRFYAISVTTESCSMTTWSSQHSAFCSSYQTGWTPGEGAVTWTCCSNLTHDTLRLMCERLAGFTSIPCPLTVAALSKQAPTASPHFIGCPCSVLCLNMWSNNRWQTRHKFRLQYRSPLLHGSTWRHHWR